MKKLILISILTPIASLTALSTAQAKDCSSFSNWANTFLSIGLAETGSFWSSVAAECEASNWATADQSAIRDRVSSMAETSGYEKPDRETVQAAAESAGVTLLGRPNRETSRRLGSGVKAGRKGQ